MSCCCCWMRTVDNLISCSAHHIASHANITHLMAEPTGRVTFGKELDLQISHNETSVFRLDFERQSAVHRVVLELVDGVIEREKGIVDGGDRGVGIVQGGAEHEATDTAESVDTERNSHAGETVVAKRKDRWKKKQTCFYVMRTTDDLEGS